jgi:hypothetical protein
LEVSVSLVFLVVASVALQPATAAAPPLAQSVADKVAKADDPDRLVCRRERVIGSRVASRKICMTVRDSERAATTTRQEMGEMIKRNTGGATPQ